MGTPLLWLGFNVFVLAAIALDLGVFHRRPHKMRLAEALAWTIALVGFTGAFGLGITHWAGAQRGLEFFTGYVIEQALSVDNLFLFLVIFRAFGVDETVQHRVLEWGILGALLARGVMILAGSQLISRFAWVLYVLGGFLILAGAHMLFVRKEKLHPESSWLTRFVSRHRRVTTGYRGNKFFVREASVAAENAAPANLKLFATPLFVVLVVVEITDITLAVDSIPAVFGITRDPFLVYTSNVFAILGLRAMYFLLAKALGRLRFLHAGLSFVLMFIGGKMVAEPWVHVSTELSLAVVAGMLLIALFASLLAPRPT
jgi:tellurite resistance protein TerC